MCVKVRQMSETCS